MSRYFVYHALVFSKLGSLPSSFFQSAHSFTRLTSRNMPKNNIAVDELKEQRLKFKISKKSLPVPSEIYLCVLGNGSRASARALYMFTDNGRYIFNCGEGTQRLSHEYKMKLAKLDNIFITHRSWHNMGGLLGLSLTIQDIGVPEINLHGPVGTHLLFKNSESFALINKLEIVAKESYNECFSDHCMTVHYIPIYSSSHTISYCNLKDNSQACKRLKMEKTLSNRDFENDMVLAYVCKGHSKPGQLLLEKCIDQGVPPGPLLGDLKNGKDITLPSGKIVYSKDVVSDEQLCPLFLVVECPSENFLDSFVNEESFLKYQKDASSPENIAELVVHFSPPHILKSEKYQNWIHRFADTTYHLFINDDNSTVNSTAIHRIQNKLHLIHSTIFPELREKEAKPLNKLTGNTFIQANTLDRYYLRPAKGFNKSLSVNFDNKEFIEEALKMEGFQDTLNELKNKIGETSSRKDCNGSFPEVIFLGTGSSIPSKVRNVSSILVKTSDLQYVLLDCGEGSCSQMLRILGDSYDFVLKNISVVFISHMHADHHLGLIQFLIERSKLLDTLNQTDCVTIIGPEKLNYWLLSYSETFEEIHPYNFIPANAIEYSLNASEQECYKINFGNVFIGTVPVIHCTQAFGVILFEKLSKWKLVYSGDTMPCNRLVDAGRSCTLLIHEATMEDELEEEAALKRHSTTSQAVQISTKMEAQHTILTHFSQRYAKVPLINEEFQNSISCAFDNMWISKKDLPILPLFLPTLNCLFAEEVEELKVKGNKRRKKQKLVSQLTNVVNN